MNDVRFGVIGMGNIGKFHAQYLLDKQVDNAVLTAVCSSSPSKIESYRSQGIRVFSDAAQLFSSGEIDAVLIATPHFQHTTLGIAALDAGVHVLVEKPISAHKADAERLIAAHRRNRGTVFAGMFQMRTEPRYQRIRTIVQSGQLGAIVRVTWINTDWYRTEAYYASGGWRATWKGEGGGVLLNQCLHNLDLLQWICDMPERIRGFCDFGRFHDIEVEDNVTAWFQWANQATGTFVSSTGEAPGTDRLEIAGTMGRLVLENGKLTLALNETDMTTFSKTASQAFAKPAARTEDIPFDSASTPHAIVTRNFVKAILQGEPLIAPGEEGINSVELANAIVYSSITGDAIKLPLNGKAWEIKLGQLAASSTRTKIIRAATDDISGSFKR